MFTTPTIGRIFIGCKDCLRVMPHYRIYGRRPTSPRDGQCRCGGTQFRPVRLPEWKAAFWVVVVGWLWRKTINKQQEWDPRMPVTMAEAAAEIPR